ncbi:MAG TPA: hypothetical protein VNQ14_03800 [Woeseiaceae bacterium]|nr:hypothetical protein [Woeseiaceae bacterium]
MSRIMQVLARSCAAFLLVAAAVAPIAQAQDAAKDADEEAAADTHERAAERDSLEPRVSSSELTASAADDRSRDSGTGAMDRLDLDRTEITGNQELPKVLYIVPWQKSEPGDLMGRPVNSLLDEVLAPLDREEFIRQVDYYSDLYGDISEEE